MAKPKKMLENHKPKENKKEGDGGSPAPQPGADKGKDSGSAAPHDDEAQDMELIKKMLDERLGSGQHTDDDAKAAHEAMKCAMSGGESKEEAMKCAGYAMKMARHMASK